MIFLVIIANFLAVWVVFLTICKVWWAPIAGVLIQLAWVAYIWAGWPDSSPLIITTTCFAAIYAMGIRTWMREK